MGTYTKLEQDIFGYEAIHLGQTGSKSAPDVLLISDTEGYQAIIDNKAYSKYSISRDHHNRMVHNYLENISNYSTYKHPIGYFTYINGGGQYLTNPYHNDKIKYKLKPLVSDDDVYRCIVEDRMGDITDKESNVLKNYQYIGNRLNELLLQGYDANAILMALDKLYVVCVPISEEDNAQKIFESINATGVKLTSADLIRNYLLMDLQSDVQEKYYADYWKKLEDNVSADSKTLELFFRMYLAIKTYNLVPKNNVYREFVKWIEEHDTNIKVLFEDLLEYAKIFNLLMNEDINSVCFLSL